MDIPINQKTIDLSVQRIANALLLNANSTSNSGLLNGKMGIVIFFYHYAQYTGNRAYQIFADGLIDDICKEIASCLSFNFEYGITGVGWGIEYLVQNGFIEADTDEILEEIDEIVYQKILLQPNHNELQGCLIYQIARCRIGKQNQNLASKYHTLLCLIGECRKILVNRNFKHFTNFPNTDTLQIINIFLNEIKKQQIFTLEINRLIDYLPSFYEIAKLNGNQEKIFGQTSIFNWLELLMEKDDETGPNFSIHKTLEYIDCENNWSKCMTALTQKNAITQFGFPELGISLLKELSSNKYKSSNLNEISSDEKDMFHIFFIAHDFSGARSYSDSLASYLSKQKDVKLYIVLKNDIHFKEFTIKNTGNVSYVYIPYKTFPNYNHKYERHIALLLYAHFNKLRNVIFHMNYENQFFLSKEIKKLFNCPVIFTVHYLGGEFSYFEKGYSKDKDELINKNLTLKNMLDFSDSVICVTKFSNKVITNIFEIPQCKVTTIYNGSKSLVNIPSENQKKHIKESLGFNTNEQIILYVGRLETGKGVDKLITAFIKLVEKRSNLRLLIAGSGDFEKYFSYSQNCPGKISFFGNIEKGKIYQLYQIADIGIIPSRFEQCSFVAIEMLQHRLPIIISDVPGLNELITHGINGLVSKVGANTKGGILEPDEDDLILQMKILLEDEKIRNNIKQNIPAITQSALNLKTMGGKHLEIYKQMMLEKA